MICRKCNAQNDDNASVCTNCGESLIYQQQPSNQQYGEQQQYTNPQYGAPQYGGQPYGGQQPYYKDIYDHTSEFEPSDISSNKVFAMLPYLMGWIGIIVALLASHESKYVGFHIRQALKLSITNTLLILISLVLCWTIIVPIVGAVCVVIIEVIQIIGFFSVCCGNAKELPIVRSLGFLK
ncbi:MAG: zinc-ribbon domain-containing protein [Monoglobaceae bacterium]